MRGLKNTQIAGTVLTRFPAASLNASKRPIETPPGSRGAGPGPMPELGGFSGSPKRIDPVTPTVNASQFFPEKGNEKLCSSALAHSPRKQKNTSPTYTAPRPRRKAALGVCRVALDMASRLYSREPELWLRQKPAAPLLCHSERSRPTFSSAFAPARCLRPESFSGTSALACGCEESLFSYDRLPQQESSSCWALATSSFPVVHSTYQIYPRIRP